MLGGSAPINDKYNRNNGKGGGSFQYYNSPRDRAPSSLPIYESYYHDRRNSDYDHHDIGRSTTIITRTGTS